MTDPDMQIVLGHISELKEEVEAIKRALARLRISTGHTGNQWLTIPPKEGEGDGGKAPKHTGISEIAGRDTGVA